MISQIFWSIESIKNDFSFYFYISTFRRKFSLLLSFFTKDVAINENIVHNMYNAKMFFEHNFYIFTGS